MPNSTSRCLGVEMPNKKLCTVWRTCICSWWSDTQDLTFSQQCSYRFKSYWMWLCVVRWAVPDVWKDQSTFTFRVKQSEKKKGCLTLNTKSLNSFETSGSTCPMAQCNIPENLNLQYWDIFIENTNFSKIGHTHNHTNLFHFQLSCILFVVTVYHLHQTL